MSIVDSIMDVNKQESLKSIFEELKQHIHGFIRLFAIWIKRDISRYFVIPLMCFDMP